MIVKLLTLPGVLAAATIEHLMGNPFDSPYARRQLDWANGKDDDMSTCRHCGRAIGQDTHGRWIDPEAPLGTDDAIWREVCDSSESFDATHEPVAWVVSDSYGVGDGQRIPILASFASQDEAAAFIGTLPGYETGRYNLDGPSDA